MNTVICSHGFGVRADSRGMFPELAAAFPVTKFVMFDYNEVLPGGDTIVAPLDAQAAALQRIIDQNELGSTLLCHSQGCIVAGLVDLTRVGRVILLAPPVHMSMQRVVDKLLKRPGSEYNKGGTSKLPRTDGTTTYLPDAYLKSLERKNPMQLYQKIADTKPTVIVRATRDEIIGLTNVGDISGVTHIDIAADHNFSGSCRAELIAVLQNYF